MQPLYRHTQWNGKLLSFSRDFYGSMLVSGLIHLGRAASSILYLEVGWGKFAHQIRSIASLAVRP